MRGACMAAVAGACGLAVSTAAAQDAGPLRLRLVCEGVHEAAESSDYHPRLAHEGGPAAGSAAALQPPHMSSVQGRIQIEISGASGRVRLPAALVPSRHKHMDNGWLPIGDLVVTEDEITGRYALNTFNTPRLRIDRTTGEIEVRGGSDFTGTCEKAPVVPVQRKF